MTVAFQSIGDLEGINMLEQLYNVDSVLSFMVLVYQSLR